MKANKRLAACAAVLALAFSVAACGDTTRQRRNTAIGAGVGAAGGAVLTGGSVGGTLGGAAVGGVIGHQTGK